MASINVYSFYGETKIISKAKEIAKNNRDVHETSAEATRELMNKNQIKKKKTVACELRMQWSAAVVGVPSRTRRRTDLQTILYVEAMKKCDRLSCANALGKCMKKLLFCAN